MSKEIPIAKLRGVVEYVLTNTHSHVYQTLYEGTVRPEHISTTEDWERIPCINKTYLETYTFWERMHVSRECVDGIRATSGTSTGKPFVCTKTYPGVHLKHFTDITPMTGYFSITTLPAYFLELELKRLGFTGAAIACDFEDADASVQLAAENSVNTVVCFTYHIPNVLPYFVKHQLGTKIDLFFWSGEQLSAQVLEQLTEVMPKARIIGGYSSVEAQSIIMTTDCSRDTDGLFLYTPTVTEESFLLEIITEDGVTLHDDECEGELLITTLWTEHNELPLIRYRTGDRVQKTTIGGKVFYKLLGRIEIDTLKIETGGILTVHELDRVMRVFNLEDSYQATYVSSEHVGDTAPHIRISIRAVDLASGDLDTLAKKVAEALHIAPQLTYADAVRAGRLKPLMCLPVAELTSAGVKKQKIIKG